MRVELRTEADATATEDVWRVYDAVFGDQPDRRTWLLDVWQRHRTRAGFRLATAHDETRAVGFAYGYTGERGQWWTDSVAAVWPAGLADRWLGGHFELVSIGVLPHARGRGTGRALLRAVTEGLPHDRWLLMTTADAADPARRLYAAEGWTVVGEGLGPDTVVLGRRRG